MKEYVFGLGSARVLVTAMVVGLGFSSSLN